MNRLERMKYCIQNNPFFTPGLVFFFSMVLLHLLFPIYGDDVVYLDTWWTQDMITHILNLYNSWTSRVIINAVVWALSHNWWYWVVSNIAIMMLLYYFLVRLFINKPDSKSCWLGVFSILLYPLAHMSTAGHLATTTNYLWPMTFGFISCYGMKKSLISQKINIWEYPIYIGSLLFAINAEQLNVFILGILTLILGYSILSKKKINIYLLIQLILATIMLIFTLQAPGNAARNIAETRARFPDYVMFGIIERAQLGYAFTLSHFIFSVNLVFTVFCILLYIAVHQQYLDKLYRFLAAVPLGSSIIFGIAQGIIPNPAISRLGQFGMDSTHIVNVLNFHQIHTYIPIVILGLVVICVLASLYLCFSNENLKAWICIVNILLGLTTGLIMGFSPTIWTTGVRALIFAYFTFIICIVLIYQKLRLLRFKHEPILFVMICFLGINAYVRYLAELII